MITSRQRIVAPEPIVTLAEMQVHLRLDLSGSPPAHPEDDLVIQKVAAATSDIDALEGWLERALMPQQWRVTLRSLPEDCARNPDGARFLPYPPLISVDSVKYLDTGGTQRTMTEGTDYEVELSGNPHGFILPRYNQIWPATADRFNAVRIEFTCGYDVDASPSNPIPDAIKQYVMVVASSMYQNREADAVNMTVNPIKQFRDAIQTFRVYGP